MTEALPTTMTRSRRETAPPLTLRRKRQALAVLAVGIVMTAATAVGDAVMDEQAWHDGYRPCITEDAPGPCYWDATERGNGLGRSYTVDVRGEVTYR